MSDICAKKVMLAALKSGSGKTTITCALLDVLKKRDLDVVSFKCGPDYIDPMFHKKVLGIEGRNLDTFFAGKEGVRDIVADAGNSYAVIEGVMGLYDGARVDTTEGSSYEVAQTTNTPVILIVDASSCGRTIISLIKGVLLDDSSNLIKGIILNKISESFYESLKEPLQNEIGAMRSDVKLLGFFPKNKELSVESRHLGLKLPGEIEDIRKQIDRAGELLEKTVDVEDILGMMEACSGENRLRESISRDGGFAHDKLTLAVAYDEAFCFYYEDNLDLFRKNGVKIEFFSPIHDEHIPEDADGILLGGGYPELYLKELSGNKAMLSSARKVIDDRIPSLAECGGFMYLHNSIIDSDGMEYEMVGAVDGKCSYTGHLVRFGYMQIEEVSNEEGLNDEWFDSLVGMKGHEFHYYDSSFNGNSFIAGKPYKKQKWPCIVTCNNGVWGFPHFYYRSDPEFVLKFIDRMREWKS